jgi:hypothetical protein
MHAAVVEVGYDVLGQQIKGLGYEGMCDSMRGEEMSRGPMQNAFDGVTVNGMPPVRRLLHENTRRTSG